MGRVTFVSTLTKDWMPKEQVAIDAGVLEVAVDIHRRAVMLAPLGETANLRNSGTIVKVKGGLRVVFGSTKVPYARRRHFENNKNPQTKYYLANAGDSVARDNLSKYFRNKV